MDYTALNDAINGSWVAHGGLTTNENGDFFSAAKPSATTFQTWDDYC